MAGASLAFASSRADADGRVACALSGDGLKDGGSTLLSKSDDPAFDNALIAELRRILRIIPINPGFKYVSDNNAYATDTTIVAGTSGTVLIGLKLVRELLKPSQGGVAVACVLAHECGHIFQFFSSEKYFDRLDGTTQRYRELHADFLAGYYLAKRMGAATAQMREVEKALVDFGDYHAGNPKDHGTPGQRLAALDKGYVLSLGGAEFKDAAAEGEKYVKVL
ncbi:hypothetical protein [Bradyrhizobium sp. MOS002]|uniref:hypothetical protein n=1 Tax=Bradyrhizobium sp. MOS002 TaxID=2133947 RepID=UPI000D12E72F|nr:hypothetical protein [Bradyrhizobium sp. MOS002]PSO30608.1 hypothetical protein C7G41_17415 [Bradyrhizobium sp. MOS002]